MIPKEMKYNLPNFISIMVFLSLYTYMINISNHLFNVRAYRQIILCTINLYMFVFVVRCFFVVVFFFDFFFFVFFFLFCCCFFSDK